MAEETINRETALNNAVTLLTAPYFGEDHTQTNALKARAWIALADTLRPDSRLEVVTTSSSADLAAVEKVLGASRSATTAAVDALVANYNRLERQFIDLKTQLRAMAVEFDTRGRVTDDPVWLDAAMLILQVVNDEQ